MYRLQSGITNTDAYDIEISNKHGHFNQRKEGKNDFVAEESDKSLNTHCEANTKNIKFFDYPNVDYFLKEKILQNKFSTDKGSTNKGYSKPIAKDSLNKTPNQKGIIPSDDFNEITHLLNCQHITRPHEVSMIKSSSDESKTIPFNNEPLNCKINNAKKKNGLNKPGINCLDEKIIERIMNKVKPKSSLQGKFIPNNAQIHEAETSEPLKNNLVFVERDKQILEKVPEKDAQIEYFDEKQHKRSTLNNIPVYASTPIIFDFKNAEIYADGHEAKNNKSCQKNGADSIEIKQNEVDESPLKFTSEFDTILYESETPFTPRINTSQTSSASNILQYQGVSSNNSFIIDDSNLSLSRDFIWRQTPTKDTLPTNKFKPNVSVLSIESSGDSESLANNIGEYQNSLSFNTNINASPFSSDTGKYMQEGSNDIKWNLNQYQFNSHIRPSLNIAAQKLQKIFPNTNPIVPNLNNSCINLFSKSSFSDNNSSFSLNYDDFSMLETNYNTPQDRIQQKFLLPNQPISYVPNTINMDPHHYQNNNTSSNNNNKNNCIFPKGMPSIPETLTYNYNPLTSLNQVDNNSKFGMAIQNQLNHNSSTSRLTKKRNCAQDDSSLFDIDINKLDDLKRTTLMIKNIPNKYDRNLLLQTIDKNHKGKYDFFYLPIDFRNRCNVGYAFINFKDCKYIKNFYTEFNGKRWEKFNSEKICSIKYARIQGRNALIQHFQFSSVMNQQDKKLKPLILPSNPLVDVE